MERYRKGKSFSARLQECKDVRTFPNFTQLLDKELKDPRFAEAFLSDALEEGDLELFLLCLKDIIRAHGSIKEFAEKTGISRTTLYTLFSEKRNPEFKTIQTILQAMGYGLKVTKTPPRSFSRARRKRRGLRV